METTDMAATDTTDHPGDYIDNAQAMLRFLSTAIGNTNQACHFNERELEGLCHILNHVEDNLEKASKLVS